MIVMVYNHLYVNIKSILRIILNIIYIEFDDGSDWTLSKCLTHANRTSNFIRNNLVRSGVQVSKRYYGYLGVRDIKFLILYINCIKKEIYFRS